MDVSEMTEYEKGMLHVLERMQEAEKIDARHNFRLPGDSALYIELWALECYFGEKNRADEPRS